MSEERLVEVVEIFKNNYFPGGFAVKIIVEYKGLDGSKWEEETLNLKLLLKRFDKLDVLKALDAYREHLMRQENLTGLLMRQIEFEEVRQ